MNGYVKSARMSVAGFHESPVKTELSEHGAPCRSGAPTTTSRPSDARSTSIGTPYSALSVSRR